MYQIEIVLSDLDRILRDRLSDIEFDIIYNCLTYGRRDPNIV